MNTPGCGTFQYSHFVTVGTPEISFISFTNPVNSDSYWCSSDYGNLFSVEPAISGVNYQANLLYWPSLTLYRSNLFATPTSDPFGYVPTGWYVFQIRATNVCGNSSWYEQEVEYVDCSLGYQNENFTISSSPNPAERELYVTIANETPEVKALSKSESVIFSLSEFFTGQVVKQWNFKNDQNQQKLNIWGVRPGQYMLTVSKGKYKQSTKVIIK